MDGALLLGRIGSRCSKNDASGCQENRLHLVLSQHICNANLPSSSLTITLTGLNASPMQRTLRTLLNFPRAQCRLYTSTPPPRFAPVPILSDASLETFRRDAFEPAVPAMLPRGAFADVPARGKWFVKGHNAEGEKDEWRLNVEYFRRFGDTAVALEILSGGGEDGKQMDGGSERFERVEMPLSVFLEYVRYPRLYPNIVPNAELLLSQSLQRFPDSHPHLPRPTSPALPPATPTGRPSHPIPCHASGQGRHLRLFNLARPRTDVYPAPSGPESQFVRPAGR